MSSQAAPLRLIPVTIITGFLGAGKTTLLTHLLTHAAGHRIAVVVNEFGATGVDGETIRGCGNENCGEDDVVELANGCLCCTVADDFLPAMTSLLGRPNPPDHIVIETSGLALPKPLLKAFNWPSVAHRMTVDGVIAVIDGPAVAEGLFADDPQAVERQRREDSSLEHENPLSEVFADQIKAADLVILNKADLLDDGGLHQVEEVIKELSPRRSVRIIPTSEGRVSTSILLGIDAAAQKDLEQRPSSHDGEDDHEHDDFVSFTIALPQQQNVDVIVKLIKKAIKKFPILRAKGFIKIANKPMLLNVQAVGRHLRHAFEAPKDGGETQGQIVVIGQKGLNAEEIAQFLDGQLTNR